MQASQPPHGPRARNGVRPLAGGARGRTQFVIGRRSECPALSLLNPRRHDDGIMAGASQDGEFVVDFQPMSPDEMQRMMQFLLNQQAQFAADVAKNEASWKERFEQLSLKTDQTAD